MPSIDPRLKGREYWRSLEELAGTPEVKTALEREFPEGASTLLESSRRGFLKVMGASLALAGLTSCMRWPVEQLAPYARRPVGREPGMPVHYASAMELGGVAQGLLIKSYDGRPIKVEGNPQHPLNKGTADVFAQASVLQLYDPDRSRGVLKRDNKKWTSDSWEGFLATVPAMVAAGGVAFLSEASRGPTQARLRGLLAQQMPEAQWFEYEPLGDENLRQAAQQVLGQNVLLVPELAHAHIVLAIESDLFLGQPLAIKMARDFASARRLDTGPAKSQTMNRLYAVESNYSNTGAIADHRRLIVPTAIPAFLAELAAALGAGQAPAVGSGLDQAFITALAEDLKANIGQSVIIAGAQQPVEIHAAVLALNQALGAFGKTLTAYPDPEPQRPHHMQALQGLTQEMQAGRVKTLFILGGNPVYNAPADIEFAAALAKVPNSVHLGMHTDETSELCQWHLTQTHYMEAWSDARSFNGLVSIIQPMILPLFDGRSSNELLAAILKLPKADSLSLVRATFNESAGRNGSDWAWKESLYTGFVNNSQWLPVDLGKADSAAGALAKLPARPAAPSKDNCELIFFNDGKTFDGRFSNVGWILELPDPMTRVTWDNAVLISKGTADAYGNLSVGDVVELTAGGKTILAPVYVQPGLPDFVLALAVGWGRTAQLTLGKDAGVNAYPLRTSQRSGLTTGAKMAPQGRKYALATVETHNLIDVDEVGKVAIQRRIPQLVREGTFDQYQSDPSMDVPKVVSLSMWNRPTFDGRDGPSSVTEGPLPEHMRHKWGMSIDLSVCTGCSACVIACQAENNVPVVGKDQVLHGREMHWIRIDRYFRADLKDPNALRHPVAVHQPVTCMHCENAPCEEVCPVGATSHSEEGLNMMTYNRCIGTRYCSNNCPYKVRRFNFFDFNNGPISTLYTPNIMREGLSDLEKMQKNPDVTVRMRGVMEKCTYCVQRIEETRITARKEGNRPFREGELKTACQQTCPTDAIVFGDLNSAESEISRKQALPRAYGMLDPELNTRPRTQYLAKVRNPHPNLDKELYKPQRRDAGAQDQYDSEEPS